MREGKGERSNKPPEQKRSGYSLVLSGEIRRNGSATLHNARATAKQLQLHFGENCQLEV